MKLAGSQGGNPSSPNGATVKGTVTLPSDAPAGKTWLVALDPTIESAGSDRITMMGTVSGSTLSYEITKVPAGAYYLYAAVDNDSSWGTSGFDVTIGDYFVLYGGPSGTKITLAADQTYTYDLTATAATTNMGGTGGNTGGVSISGKLTFPAAIAGKCVMVVVTASTSAKPVALNLYPNVSGTTLDYTVANVPDGTYLVNAAVWKTTDAAGGCDYIGYYGISSANEISGLTANVTVGNDNVTGKDIGLFAYP
jgi:hypothetical protein